MILAVARCKGCGGKFRPKTKLQTYHSKSCSNQGYKDRKKEQLAEEAERKLEAQLPAYVAAIEKAKPKDAVGYRLYSKELGLFLPVPWATRRDGLRVTNNCFALEPVEIPISPLAAAYDLFWVYPNGVALASSPLVSVAVGWADDCSKKKVLAASLVAYRAAIREEKRRASDKVTQQAHAQNLALYQEKRRASDKVMQQAHAQDLALHKAKEARRAEANRGDKGD